MGEIHKVKQRAERRDFSPEAREQSLQEVTGEPVKGIKRNKLPVIK